MAFSNGLGVKKKKFVPPALQITSMMDMFTIIVFFLLFAYSDKPQDITIKEKLYLPNSNSTKDYSNTIKVLISKDKILIDEELVATLSGEKITGIEEHKLESSQLFKVLKIRKERAAKLKEDLNVKDDGTPVSVLFFCDKDTPYSVIQSVMRVSGLAGYPNFQLAVMQDS